MSALSVENHIAKYYNAKYILIYKQQLTPMLLLWGHGPFSFYCITGIGPDDDSHTISNSAANI